MRIYDIGINTKHTNEFKIDRPVWKRDYLFLYLRTSAIFVINGKKIVAPKNSAILYHVGTPQHYYANEDTYSDSFIHLFIDDDYSFFSDLKIPFDTIIELPASKSIPTLLKDIYKEYLSINKNKELTIDLLLKLLFAKISNFIDDSKDIMKFHKYKDNLSNLRTEIYLHPNKNWNIPTLAQSVNLSPSYFQYLYKQNFGCSCINDVINSRISYAKYNLTMTSYPIKEIGILCGYNNEEFFLRQFKKITRQTPSEYRKNWNKRNQ